jgi:pimeloyl-ACP methyl ester carboxylesterase
MVLTRAPLLKLALSAALLASGLLPSSPATAKGPWRLPAKCSDRIISVQKLSIQVEGKPATGRYDLPLKKAKTLVVFAHGYGHTSKSWSKHMQRAAQDHGVAAVTMDYRGLKISPDANDDGLPESRGWPVMAGAEDLVAIAQHFDATCPSIKNIVLMGVSMGGNASGLAMALTGANEYVKTDGSPLFDYWIDVEGATNMTETYFEARAIAPANAFGAQAQEDIEAETGGPIEENPEAFEERTVVARSDDIATSGVKGVVVLHGVDDGLVPYNQSREMATLLAQSQIPTEMVTIGTKSEESERETTLSGYVMNNVDPNYRSPLAGHASEMSTTHIVMVTAFDRLWKIVAGNGPTAYEETPVNGS